MKITGTRFVVILSGFLVILLFLLLVFQSHRQKVNSSIIDKSVVPGYYQGTHNSSKDDNGIVIFEYWATLPRKELVRLSQEEAAYRKELIRKGVKLEELHKYKRETPRDSLKNINLQIYVLNSKVTEQYVKSYKESATAIFCEYYEGTFSGKPIGDKCWIIQGPTSPATKEPVYESPQKRKTGETETMLIMKNNVFLVLTFIDPEGVDKEFAEKVARHVVSKF
jgi:hypothetical protein